MTFIAKSQRLAGGGIGCGRMPGGRACFDLPKGAPAWPRQFGIRQDRDIPPNWGNWTTDLLHCRRRANSIPSLGCSRARGALTLPCPLIEIHDAPDVPPVSSSRDWNPVVIKRPGWASFKLFVVRPLRRIVCRRHPAELRVWAFEVVVLPLGVQRDAGLRQRAEERSFNSSSRSRPLKCSR